MKKVNVGILFGGKSAEHEVSLQSAKNVIDAIDRDTYDITLIAIDKTGKWCLQDESAFLLNAHDPKQIALHKTDQYVSALGQDGQNLIVEGGMPIPIDVVFPILHGTYGEDGTVQGLLKLANIPFVGAGVLGSAIGMDKDVMKRLLRDSNIPIAKFLVFHKNDERPFFADVSRQLGLPLFVKPANAGSSVGVSKVTNDVQFTQAMDEAFSFDSKVLVEEYIEGREVECSVLGNEAPRASQVGEIIPQQDFYSYEAKYIDEQGAVLQVPACIDAETSASIQEMALKTYKVLCCEGMARVDCFLTKNRGILVNEINTIPGFTRISMYPKLWEISGLSYRRLIDTLIQLALDRHGKEQQLRTSFTELR